MAFSQLQFSKDWNNSTDFPTYEPSEAQVRADIQFLYDEIKDYLNDSFLPELSDALSDLSDDIEDRLTEEMADELYLRYLASPAGPIISVREILLRASDGTSGTANIYATGDDFAPHVLFKPNLGSGNTVLEYIADPTADNQAANKHYVDDTVSDYLPLTGGTMTGNINIARNAINFFAGQGLQWKNGKISVVGALQPGDDEQPLSNIRIADPTSDEHAANKAYVDDALSDYTKTSDLADVATSGSYDDLTNKPTIPTVNNATLTIKQGGVTKGTFGANASADATINLDAAEAAAVYVTYGDNVATAKSAVIAAIDAGTPVYCIYEDGFHDKNYLRLQKYTADKTFFFFGGANLRSGGGQWFDIALYTGWDLYKMEKVDTVSSASTDNEIPTAAAVWGAITTAIGDAIGGSY